MWNCIQDPWRRLEDYCFLSALKAAVSAFPRSDFALQTLTSSACPQPWKCLTNSVFVVSYSFLSILLRGPYLVVDTLFIKPRLYRLYLRYLEEGERLQGTVISKKPAPKNQQINITLVEYTYNGTTYLKYIAHAAYKDEHHDEHSKETIVLLLLPHYPKSACSHWTAALYVEQHSTYHCLTMILWSLFLTLLVALLMALVLYLQLNDAHCVTKTLAFFCPSALVLVAFFLYLRDDPVQQFLLESGRIKEEDEELGNNVRVNQWEQDGAAKTVPTDTAFCGATEGYFCGVGQHTGTSLQEMNDRGDLEDQRDREDS